MTPFMAGWLLGIFATMLSRYLPLPLALAASVTLYFLGKAVMGGDL